MESEDGRAEMVSGRRSLVCGRRLKTEGVLLGREMRGILQGSKAFLSEGDRLAGCCDQKVYRWSVFISPRHCGG